jgi:hypothetical protein
MAVLIGLFVLGNVAGLPPLGFGPVLDLAIWGLGVAVLGGILYVLLQSSGSGLPGARTRISRDGRPSSNSESAEREPSPEEIVRQRYARGEIDRQRYFEMLADLERRS